MVAACQYSLDGKRRQVNPQNLVVSQKTKRIYQNSQPVVVREQAGCQKTALDVKESSQESSRQNSNTCASLLKWKICSSGEKTKSHNHIRLANMQCRVYMLLGTNRRSFSVLQHHSLLAGSQQCNSCFALPEQSRVKKENRKKKRRRRKERRSKAQILLLCTRRCPLGEKDCCLLTMTGQSWQQPAKSFWLHWGDGHSENIGK